MRPAQCPGAFTAHADGTAGECSLGPDCVGGEHTVVVECRAAWPWCGYCLTRRCTAALLVHDTGVAECQLGVGCGGTWHDGVVASCAELGAPEHCCPPT